MFRVLLDQMENRQTEIAAFAEKQKQLLLRLEGQIKALEAMESFSGIANWLKQTEENMRIQVGQTREMGAALESIIRFYQNSEANILEHLENGPVHKADAALTFAAPEALEGWPDLMEF